MKWSTLPRRLAVALLCTAAVAVPAATAEAGTPVPSNWPSVGANAAQTHNNPNEKTINIHNVAKLVQRWNFGPSGGGWEGSQPAVVNGVAYFGQGNGIFYAVNDKTGYVLWSFQSDGDIAASSPAVANGLVYFGSQDGFFYALNAATGALSWKYTLSGVNLGDSPTVMSGKVFVSAVGTGTSGAGVYAFNALTGRRVWRHSGDEASKSVAVAAGQVFVVEQSQLVALSTSSGKVIWSQPFLGGFSSVPTVTNGVVYAWGMAGSANGSLKAYGAAAGNLLWENPGSWFSGNQAFANGRLYVSYSNYLYALQPLTGLVLWSVPSNWENPTKTAQYPSVANGVLYYLDGDGYMTAANAASGAKIWHAPFGGTTGVTVADGGLLVGDADGNEHAYRLPSAAAGLVAASAPGDPWVDDAGTTGTAALTFGNIGCSAVDANTMCTGGGWPVIAQAPWIWTAQSTVAGQDVATFTKTFTVSAAQAALPETLTADADDFYTATLNGVQVVSNGSLGTPAGLPVQLQVGTNTLSFTVTNDVSSGPGGDDNPAGLAWKIVAG